MTYERAVVERRLRERANTVLARPHEFAAQQVRWARLFTPGGQTIDAFQEWALLDASFPALFSDEHWYEYFADRCERFENEAQFAELPDQVVARVHQLRRRFAAFAGQYRAPERRVTDSLVKQTRSLVIGIDIRPLAIPSTRNRGIGRFLIGTLTELVKLNAHHRLVMLGDQNAISDKALSELFASDRVEFRILAPGCDQDLDLFLLTDPCPMLVGRRTAELPVSRVPWMSIVYDFIPLEFPDLYLRGNDVILEEYLDNIDTLAERSLVIFPISQYVGQQSLAVLGLPDARVIPIMGGVDPTLFDCRVATKAPIDRPYFLYVGGADARKNIPGLIRAFDLARASLPAETALVLVGEMNGEKTKRLLKQIDCEHLCDFVIGVGGVDDDVLRSYYVHAIATVFVSLSEGLGLPALEAMATGCPVIASNGSALAETVGSCGLLVDPRSSSEIASALTTMSNDENLRAKLIVEGRKHAAAWRWTSVAQTLLSGIETYAVNRRPLRVRSRRMRVAMLNRPNVWTAPGGDGRVMLQMQSAVKPLGIDIFFPQSSSECENADAVHFVNLTLPEPLARAADLAQSSRVPFIVTTLYEDWNQYLEPSHKTFALTRQFVDGSESLDAVKSMIARQQASGRAPRLRVDDVLARTTALFACGESEAARLRQDFPSVAERVRVVPFAVAAPAEVYDSVIQSLYQSLGFDQFVLCIGRLETRKNQLMLLAALHDEDIPIVFAAGGYTPQPEYRATVNRWKRKAPVRYVDHISWASMSALIRAAAVHALPSFYELPGLVHLECAAAGIPIVASTWGALNDYLPTNAFIPCEPIDAESIHSAVSTALSAPSAPRAADLAKSFSLERLGETLATEYEEAILSPSRKRDYHSYRIPGTIAAETGGLHVAVR